MDFMIYGDINEPFINRAGRHRRLGPQTSAQVTSFARASAQEHSVPVEYLFVDSNPKSFRDDDPKWTVLGKSLVLPERSRLAIEQADLRAVVRNLPGFPRLKPWLGDREAWGAILNGLNVNSAGGQMRRLGRFLFTMSVERFCNQVQTLIADLQIKLLTMRPLSIFAAGWRAVLVPGLSLMQ